MNNKIKIGIVGYGNLGRGVEAAIAQNADMEAVGGKIFCDTAAELEFEIMRLIEELTK